MALTSDELLTAAPVIPVVVLDDAADAVPLAQALTRGGLPVIEVTLRTDAALDAIERIAAEVPEAIVGAGTIVDGIRAQQAVAAGAQFLVSPGQTPVLLDALETSGVPFLAGAATPSDVMALLERGITVAKLFPAEALNGRQLLKALSGPFAQMRFCPTGGIDADLAREYLALPNVGCVGGSWMVSRDAIAAGDFDTVEALSRTAARLGGGTVQLR